MSKPRVGKRNEDWARREAEKLVRWWKRHKAETKCPGDCLRIRAIKLLRRAADRRTRKLEQNIVNRVERGFGVLLDQAQVLTVVREEAAKLRGKRKGKA